MITLGGLHSDAAVIAQELFRRDITRGHVLLAYPPGLDFIRAFFGCMYAGVTAIPIHPGRGQLQGRGNLIRFAEDVDCRAVLTTAAQMPDIAEALKAASQQHRIQLVVTDAIAESAAGHDFPIAQVDPEMTAYIQYTSGSSGTPKGVMLTHANILGNLSAQQKCMGFKADDLSLSWLPMSHDMGLIGNILSHALYGVRTQYLMSPFAFILNPVRWLQAITDLRITVSGGPNFAYDLCARKISEEAKASLDLSSWSIAYCGAEPVRPGALSRFLKAFASCGFDERAFLVGYGLAESTLIVTTTSRGQGLNCLTVNTGDLQAGIATRVSGESGGTTLVSCGRVVEGHEIAIVDPESRSVIADDNVGEIWVSGPSVSRGYWRSDGNEKVFSNPHPSHETGSYLRTGDLGFMTGGELFVTGRLKDTIIIRGSNFMAEALEATAIESAELLAGCSAVALPVVAETGEELLVAVEIAPAMEARIAADVSMASSLFQSVSTAILDTHEVRVSEFLLLKFGGVPRTTSGKVRRKECLANFLGGVLPILYRHRP